MYFVTWSIITIVTGVMAYLGGEEHWLGFTIVVSIIAGLISAFYKKIGFKTYWTR